MPRHVRQRHPRQGPGRGRGVFAAQKQRLRLLVRTIGMARATTKLGLPNLAYNLLRFTCIEGRAAPA